MRCDSRTLGGLLLATGLLLQAAASRGADPAPADPVPADPAPNAAARQWAQWRGPLATGEAPHADPPIRWSEDTNIRWKTRIPGRGHSTPVVWGTRIYLTAALPIGEKLPPRYSGREGAHDNRPITQRQQFVVLALDRKTGKIVWRKVVNEALPHEGGHYTATLASASPVTDGKRVYAFFGSYGLYCLNSEGQLQWKRDFGRMNTRHGHGEGASPALHGDLLLVNWDHEEQSFLEAIDKRTGKTRWRATRDEVTSWSTPIVVERPQESPQVIVSGTDRLRGYDLASGKVLWECGGLSRNIVASPVAGQGMVFAASSYDTRALLAIKLEGARGNITGTPQVAWSTRLRTPYVPSPLLYRGSLYFLRHYQGILSRLEAKTGEEKLGPYRLGILRDIYASPVAAAGRVYVTDLNGLTAVIEHSDKPRLLALNPIGESVAASAAVVDKEIFLRGAEHLFCIASE